MSEKLQCPVSSLRTDENVVRIIALQVVVLAIVGVWASNPFLFVLLLIDFAIRSLTDGKWSLLRQIALQLSLLLNLKKKIIPAEPKKFAALVGATFSLFIGGLYFIDFEIVASILGFVLIACAILESFFGVCVGCYFYTFLQFIKVGMSNQKTV